MSTDGPIEEEYHAQLNAIAEALDKTLNGKLKGEDRALGFILLMFEFGEEGRVNYISNAEREHCLCAMKEFIARAEGRHIEETQTPVPGEQ